MYANTITLFFCLSGLVTFGCASSNDAADKQCQETQGGPSWEAELDVNGKVIGCRKMTVEKSCFPSLRNPSTGKFECCPAEKSFQQVPDGITGEGACCDVGEELQRDQGKSGCCSPGKAWKWDVTTSSGVCIDPLPPQHNRPSNCAIQSPCVHKNVCPCNGLGIQYGKCYTLQDTNGLHLGREINSKAIYRSGGEINNIVFRVCRSVDDCGGDMGKEVSSDGKWLMQDQLGTSHTPGHAWWGNAAPHMGATTVKTDAASFTGELYCYNGQCGVCMRQVSTQPGLNAPCPMPGSDTLKVHVGTSKNPMNCKAYFYQETPCLKGASAVVEAKTEL